MFDSSRALGLSRSELEAMKNRDMFSVLTKKTSIAVLITGTILIGAAFIVKKVFRGKKSI